MHTDRYGNTHRQKCHAKGSRKEAKIQDFMYKDTTYAEPEMCDYTGNICGHWNSNKMFKEIFERPTRKIFNKFTTKDSCAWNITHNMENIAVWNFEAWAVGIIIGSKEVSGRKGLWQTTASSTTTTIIITILLLLFLFLHISNQHGFSVFCTRSFRAFLSLLGWLQFLSFSFFKSFITLSIHPFFGCPLVLALVGF